MILLMSVSKIVIKNLYYNLGEYFDSSTWSGNPSKTETPSTLNKYWNSGTLITPTRSDYVTATFYVKLKAASTDTFTLYAEADDTIKVYVDGSLLINNGGNGNFSCSGNLILS